MLNKHPITPPPELVQQWLSQFHGINTAPGEATIHMYTAAAQWGADQELEACCKYIHDASSDPAVTGDARLVDNRILSKRLRAARRPKPPSLKDQALHALGAPAKIGEARVIERREHDIIRRALEALPDE